MATFPHITARDYAVRQGPHSLEQEPIPTPRYEFQFTSNFDFYPSGKQDFAYLDPPYNNFATVRSDIASCLWESLKMKVRFVLAAARNGNCDSASDLLMTFISNAKLQEINMIHPPFPPAHQLTSNPFLRPGHPTVVETWVLSWQTTSRMLTTWIAQAQKNSSRVPTCSWRWPAPHLSLTPIADSSSDAESTDIASTATEFSSISEIESVPSSQAVLASHVHATLVSPKRSRNSSPVDSQRDRDGPKKQLVLWRPSIGKLLEEQRALSSGEVSSGSSISSIPPVPLTSHAPTFTLNPRLRIDDPRLHATSPAQARYTLANSLACLERLHRFVHGPSSD